MTCHEARTHTLTPSSSPLAGDLRSYRSPVGVQRKAGDARGAGSSDPQQVQRTCYSLGADRPGPVLRVPHWAGGALRMSRGS